MYVLIDLETKKSISSNVKSIVSRNMGISSTTLWRLLGSKNYLEYKNYILVVPEMKKLPIKKNNSAFMQQISRTKELKKIISNENMYQKQL